MQMTRRGFLSAVPAAFLVPKVGDWTPPRSEALEWTLDQLRPGVLMVVQARRMEDKRDFILDVIRVLGNQLAGLGQLRSPVDLKHDAVRSDRPAICGAQEHHWDAIRVADIVVCLNGDGRMRVIKHRFEPWWAIPEMMV